MQRTAEGRAAEGCRGSSPNSHRGSALSTRWRSPTSFAKRKVHLGYMRGAAWARGAAAWAHGAAAWARTQGCSPEGVGLQGGVASRGGAPLELLRHHRGALALSKAEVELQFAQHLPP